MPRPLSRLFPKISVKADFAQLVLQPNAIATLIDADSPAHPTRPAPKNLPIILGRSFRFTLRVNIPQFSLSLLSNHLRQALQAYAGSLGINSVSVSEDSTLLVEATDSPPPGQSHLPSAVLDYIILDYRFTRRSQDFDEFAMNTSEDTGLFLPLRQLLDDAVQKLICVHLVRQLPHGFGPWKESLSNELVLADSTSKHISHILYLSSDSEFQRKVQKQLRRINVVRIQDRREVDSQIGISNEDSDIDQNRDEGEQVDLESLISFAIHKTFTTNIRPKALKSTPLSNTQTDRLDLLEELDESQSTGAMANSQVINTDEELDVLEYDDEILDNEEDLLVMDSDDDARYGHETPFDDQNWGTELALHLDSPLLNGTECAVDLQRDLRVFNGTHIATSAIESQEPPSIPSPAAGSSQELIDSDFDSSARDDRILDWDEDEDHGLDLNWDIDPTCASEHESLELMDMSSPLLTPELSNSQTDTDDDVLTELWYDGKEYETEDYDRAMELDDLLGGGCALRLDFREEELLLLDSP